MAVRPIRVLDQRERDPRTFSREELFDQNGRSLILPEAWALKKIKLSDKLDRVELRVGGLIGYLPLTPQIALNLVPKFPIANLWRMLEIADGDYDCIFPVLRSYQAADTTPPHEMLVRAFCHYLRAVLTDGVARGYFLEAYRGFYRPKVHFGRTLSGYLARGDALNVASDTFAFSANISPNALLKSACLAFLALMPHKPDWAEDRSLIGEGLNALRGVEPVRMRFGDQEKADESVPVWLREGYRGALTVYAMLLGYSRVGFEHEAHGVQMASFLFSLDDIFESYVRNIFRRALAVDKIAVLDGNRTQHHGRLFLDNKLYPTKPDLIFRRQKVIIGLGEVKYKPKIEETDRYQVLSHVQAANCTMGVWISPAAEGNKGGLEYVGRVPSGAKFHHYKLDIGGDLEASSAAMVEAVSALLPA